MSNEVTEYLVSRGELLRADNLRPAEVNRLVDAEAYRALEAECDKWHQQFDCMQLQRDHHRNTVKALRAELERVRQGSLFLLDAHAELEAARRQEPVATVHSGKNASGMPWCEVEWHVSPEPPAGTKLYALPPLAGKVSVPDVCDGREQEAFEAFAKRKGMDTSMHPLHWLFLNRETYAARQGWKAAIRYCRALLATPSMEVKS